MKSKVCVKVSFFLCIFLSLLFANPAHAYLDPGAGSAILQGILAAVVAIGLTIKIFWHRLLKFLRIRKDDGLSGKEINADKN